jgi:hypothetical protein
MAAKANKLNARLPSGQVWANPHSIKDNPGITCYHSRTSSDEECGLKLSHNYPDYIQQDLTVSSPIISLSHKA